MFVLLQCFIALLLYVALFCFVALLCFLSVLLYDKSIHMCVTGNVTLMTTVPPESWRPCPDQTLWWPPALAVCMG